MIKRLTYAFLMLMLPFAGWGDVLYWMIDETSYVDNNPMSAFVSSLPDDEDNWAVGRVKITTGAGVVRYLNTYVPDGNPNNPGIEVPGNEGLYVGGGGVFEGVPENTQGRLPSDVDSTSTFEIEIGMNHWIDDGTEEGIINFELLAITDPHTYEQLRQFMYIEHDINPPEIKSWNPTYYHTVSPEPSTGFLFLIGSSLLALKRKHK